MIGLFSTNFRVLFCARRLRERLPDEYAIAAAKERSVRFGPKPKDKPEMFESCKERWERREISARKAAKQLQVSHNTFLKWVRREKMETKTNENRIEM